MDGLRTVTSGARAAAQVVYIMASMVCFKYYKLGYGLIPRNYHISVSFLSGRKFAAIGRLIRRRQWITVTVVTVINQELHN